MFTVLGILTFVAIISVISLILVASAVIAIAPILLKFTVLCAVVKTLFGKNK